MPFNKVNNAHLDLKWVYYNFTEKKVCYECILFTVFCIQFTTKNTLNMKYKI